MIKILYKDKYLLLCEKPVGLNTQFSEDKTRKNLPELLSARLGEAGENDYVGLVHRLDVATGGVIMYSRDKSITGKLCDMVSSKEYRKTYLCVVHGYPEQNEGTLCDLLYHDKQKNKTYVVKKERRGVKPASLNYRVLQTVQTQSGEISLIEVELLTGRTHQIRVQLASRKMPLLGDGKYGSHENGCSMALWSYAGEFSHPITGKSVCVKSTPEDKFPWSLFNISRENL